MVRFFHFWILAQMMTASCPGEEKSGHLFILSGQSNMTGGLGKGFAAVVTEELGPDATIVHHSKGGRGIRFWVADYALPAGHPMAALSHNKSNGEEFPKLVALVKKNCRPETFKTVHLIWMQGESDANRDLAAAYGRSFKVLTARLEKALGIEEMHFVIGRLSDYGLYGDEEQKEAWTRMRQVQESLAHDHPLGSWIDTDPFIPRAEKERPGNLHYPPAESVKLGERFGKAALSQIASFSSLPSQPPPSN